ncbi:ABC transporter substrate-binding protein [Spirochaeta isovalerica]|uniref:Branched-chain amino acid transport system substrate-binding protein n=1 Tax=Spirochaeta isovalerica TaxID=150 RepID=A0A841RDX1_9SPIO|nr:ABC transporter substrate-binding protein [Spirochaeta isovalerica]MBB6481581.1 branched-chain amino acid transport system substrate-binding protein [Spirochaeta isovalerica]
MKSLRYSVLLLAWVLLISCGEKEPVKVGFTSWLSGPNSVLGIAGRDAVELAFDQVNEAGGINGRLVELVIKDDLGDAEQAVKGDRELIDAGCVAILGHMHSSMCIAALPQINEQKILMISPTASSDQLSGQDDYFFRIAPLASMEIEKLAKYAVDNLNLKNMVCVYDMSNQGYSERWNSDFNGELKKSGRSFIRSIPFNSVENPDYGKIAESIMSAEPDGLLLVANSISTALICQQLDKRDARIGLLSTGWANSDDFIQTGGPAVNGVTFAQARDLNSSGEKYRDFVDSFKESYNRAPDMASIYSYEAALVMIDLLKKTTDRDKLREELKSTGRFDGLQQDITFDAFGENRQEEYFYLQVRDGKLVTINP